MSIRIPSDESHCKPGCSQLDVEDAVSNMFESNAAGVQQNVVTAKNEGKKARHKSNITSFQVNNPYL